MLTRYTTRLSGWRAHKLCLLTPRFLRTSPPRREPREGQPSPIVVGKTPLFDTLKVVTVLKAHGLTEAQAIAISQALVVATDQSHEITAATLASKAELATLSSQLNEKVFNSTLKHDMQQKHIKDLFTADLMSIKSDMVSQNRAATSDFAAFKSDVQMKLKVELSSLQQQVLRAEKEIENSRQFYRSEQEHLENRLIRIGGTALVSLIGIAITAMRLFMK